MEIDEKLLIKMMADQLSKDNTFRTTVAMIAAKNLLDSSGTPSPTDVVVQIKNRVAELTRVRAEELGREVARNLDHRVAQKVENVLSSWSETSIRNILGETVRRVAYDVLAKRLRPHLHDAVKTLLAEAAKAEGDAGAVPVEDSGS